VPTGKNFLIDHCFQQSSHIFSINNVQFSAYTLHHGVILIMSPFSVGVGL